MMNAPNVFKSVLNSKCPRCRKGKLFINKNGYQTLKLNAILAMPERCPECNQKIELETGFWYGTSYVSYALTVALAISIFVAWWVLFGFSLNDSSLFYCLGLAITAIFLLQPWIMRLSRVIYIYFFVSYNPNYKNEPPKGLS